MEEYQIKKVLNNNVVIAEKNGLEYVLVGKAIGFDSNKGAKLAEGRIESVFVKQSVKMNENYNRILQNISSEIVGISEEIIALCEKDLNLKLSDAIHVSLPDHINFAIRRMKENIKIQNPFLHELMALYPKEYRLSGLALNMINERLNANLPEDEIGFICMHIKAAIAKQDVSDAVSYTRKIGEIMEFIYKLLKIEIDRNSLSYLRTITHINFMIERLLNHKPVKNNLIDNIKKEYYNEFDIAIKIAMKIENLFSVRVPEDEIGFITIHIIRMTRI